jgi:hypothetical protein
MKLEIKNISNKNNAEEIFSKHWYKVTDTILDDTIKEKMKYCIDAMEEYAKLKIEEIEFEKDMLEENVKTLKHTCIELSKRASYTEEEKEKYWEFECECGFTGLSMLVLGGGQIADTGDYGDCYCPCCEKIVG